MNICFATQPYRKPYCRIAPELFYFPDLPISDRFGTSVLGKTTLRFIFHLPVISVSQWHYSLVSVVCCVSDPWEPLYSGEEVGLDHVFGYSVLVVAVS